MEFSISPFYLIKCLFVGKQGVGKSTIVNILDGVGHDPRIPPTIGIEFTSLLFDLQEFPVKGRLPKYYFDKIPDDLKDIKQTNPTQMVKCYVWDTSGQDRFFSIVKSYVRDVDIAFLTFDLNDRFSWNELVKWKEELDKHANSERSTKLVIIGTKKDLPHHEVDEDEIKVMAQKWNADYFLLSSVKVDSYNKIKEMMYNCVNNYHKNILKQKEVPKHLKPAYYMTHESYVDLNTETSKYNFCCHQ